MNYFAPENYPFDEITKVAGIYNSGDIYLEEDNQQCLSIVYVSLMAA